MRHLYIPDTQCKPGVPMEHLDWVARAIVEYRPDRIIHAGDHWDMPSLSTHSAPGSMEQEGARYTEDIDAGNEGMARIVAQLKKTRWRPLSMHFTTGNHENRIERAVQAQPKLEGALSMNHLEMHGFERVPFLEVLWLDGIAYAHYFQQQNSGRPLGGSIDSRLNRIGESFVQGHQQGFMYANRTYPTGRIRHGLVAGSCYLHDEDYKGPQGNSHWRGIVVLNDVRDGNYEVMPLSLDYLRRKYGKGK